MFENPIVLAVEKCPSEIWPWDSQNKIKYDFKRNLKVIILPQNVSNGCIGGCGNAGGDCASGGGASGGGEVIFEMSVINAKKGTRI